jgi:putative autotransporter adhesin-like protein
VSRFLGRIALVSLTVGVVSLALAYAFGGRDLARLLEHGNFVVSSCDNGDAKAGDSERRMAWSGDSIDVSLPGTVRYRAGEGSDIVVRGAPEIVRNVDVRGGHLVLTCRWHAASRDIEVALPGQTLRRVGISGAGNVEMEGLNQHELHLSISGSGDLRARGQVDQLTVRVAGSGNARLGELQAKRLKVEISGSGNVDAAPQDEANIRIAGSGNVRLLTRPNQLKTHIAGSGRVNQPQEAAEGKK